VAGEVVTRVLVDLTQVYRDLARGDLPAAVRERYGLDLEAAWPSALGALRREQPNAWDFVVARWGEERVLQGCALLDDGESP
jgi:hypothetical protein